jgi:hypothetical protein
LEGWGLYLIGLEERWELASENPLQRW